MLTLSRARTSEIYRNCLKSMLKYDVTLKCLMSDDSESKNEILDLIKKKTGWKALKKKTKLQSQMKTAKQLFEITKGDGNAVKSEATEEPTKGNLAVRINELIKVAKAIPDDSSKDLEISIAQKKPFRKRSFKKEFLENAEKVAVTLGDDVEATRRELVEAFEITDDDAPGKKDVRRYKSQRGGQFDSESQKPMAITFMSKFDSSGLDIFKKNVGEKKDIPRTLETWKQLKQIELLQSSFHPPQNYFEEQINWTNQGKLWHFPINNDQGWDEEISTDFTDHIFLDKHLEPWCPKTGPIRHFMELVTTGLSKNPHLSAEKKRKILFWYRDYFCSKSSLLTELGVYNPQITAIPKQLEAGENKS